MTKIKLYCAGVVNNEVVPMKEHEDGDWIKLEDAKILVKQAYYQGVKDACYDVSCDIEEDSRDYVKEVFGDDH